MRVLDRLADRDEQLQPLPRREVVLVAVAGDRHPLDEIHDEVRPATAGGAAVQHAGDVGVVHQGQRLPLGLEAGDDLPGVHARLDQLDGDQALDRLGLLGHPDAAHAAFADLLDELVRADHRAGAFRDRLVIVGRIQDCGAALEETVARLVCLEQPFDPCPQELITGTRLVEIGGPLGGIVNFQRRDENGSFGHGVF